MLKADTTPKRKIILATRGSPLALAQTHRVLNTCAHAFPHLRFEIRVIKTTGDKLQTASLAHTDQDSLPSPTAKGLFTKELENALTEKSADMAIHSLKDLPTELPEGLILGGVLRRADAHDLLIYRSQALAEKLQSAVTDWAPGVKSYRGFKRGLKIKDLPQGATIASSSTRRQVQIQHLRPDIRVIPIRGNVGTRIRKLREHPEIDATLLAAAGLERLEYHLFPDGHFTAPKTGSDPKRFSGVFRRSYRKIGTRRAHMTAAGGTVFVNPPIPSVITLHVTMTAPAPRTDMTAGRRSSSA